MNQQDILDSILHYSSVSSKKALKLIDKYIQSNQFHEKSFLEPISSENNYSLLINIVCYSTPSLAYDILKKMSAYSIDWFEKYEYNTYVDLAISTDNIDILKFLIENTGWNEAIKNYLMPCGFSPIHYASEQNAIKCLGYLTEVVQLDINGIKKDYGNALSIATLNGSFDCVRYLIECTSIDKYYDFGLGHHALFTAISSGNPALVKYLIDLNIYDLHAINTHGDNLLFHVLEEKEGNNSFNLVFPFFKNTPICFQDKEGEHYFFSLLKNHNHENLFSLLEQINIDLTNIVSPIDGQDLLMRASFHSSLEFITYLIEQKGLNPREHTESNQNVLTNAVRGSNWEVVQYYLNNGYHLEINTFKQCFDILKEKKNDYKKEGGLLSLFYEQEKNEQIEYQLNKFYTILLEKQTLENSFIIEKKDSIKKLKV
jgi:ankyrin repeat protein